MGNVVATGIANTESPVKSRRPVIFALRAFISFGLLVFIIISASMREVFQTLATTNLFLVAFAPLLNLAGATLTSIRWQGLLASQGLRIPLVKLIQSCMVAGFFRQFLPSTVGGDVIRAYDSWRYGADKKLAVYTLAVDRILGLCVLLVLALVALAIFPALVSKFPSLLYWLIGGLGLLTGLVCIIFVPTPRVKAILLRIISGSPRPLLAVGKNILTAVSIFQGKRGLLLRSLLLSVALQVNVVMFYFAIAKSLGLGIPLKVFFVIVPVAVCVMLIPVSINAIGIREGIFVLLLGLFGVDTAQALAFAWLEYAVFLFFGLIGGIVFAFRKTGQTFQK